MPSPQYTVSDVLVLPANLDTGTPVRIRCCAGGGGGQGGAANPIRAGVGGGGGAYAEATYTGAPGDTLVITITGGGTASNGGAGSPGGAASDGFSGGDTEVDKGATTLCLALGGGGGGIGGAGSGGTAVTGNVSLVNGSNGGVPFATTGGAGGAGGTGSGGFNGGGGGAGGNGGNNAGNSGTVARVEIEYSTIAGKFEVVPLVAKAAVGILVTDTATTAESVSMPTRTAVQIDSNIAYHNQGNTTLGFGAALSQIGPGFAYSTSIGALAAALGFSEIPGLARADSQTLSAKASDTELVTLLKGVATSLGAAAYAFSVSFGFGKVVTTTLSTGSQMSPMLVNLEALGIGLATAWSIICAVVTRGGARALLGVSVRETETLARSNGITALLKTGAALAETATPRQMNTILLPVKTALADSASRTSGSATTLAAGALLIDSPVRATPLAESLAVGARIADSAVLTALIGVLNAASASLIISAKQAATLRVPLTAGARAQVSMAESLVAVTALGVRAAELQSFKSTLALAHSEGVAAGLSAKTLLPILRCAETLGVAVTIAESIGAVKALHLLYSVSAVVGVSLNRQTAVAGTSLGASARMSDSALLKALAQVGLPAALLLAALEVTERYEFASMEDQSFTAPTIIGETFITDPGPGES